MAWGDAVFEDLALVTAAREAFSNWGRALRAAGIPFEPQRIHTHPCWLRQHVITCLLQRHQDGKSLDCTTVLKEYPALIEAACTHFGT